MKTKKFNLYLSIQILLAVYTIFFLVVYAIGADNIRLFKESFDNLMNGVYCLALSFLPYVVRKFKIDFTDSLAVYYIIAIMAHFIGGGTFWGYKTKYYSFGVHLINSFLMGVVCYGIILRNVKKQGKLFMFITTFACVMLIGACWELVEYFIDTVFDGNMQKTLNSKTLEPFIGKRAVFDTMTDVLMDLSGGILAGLLSGVRLKGKPLYAYLELKSAKYRPAIFGEVTYYLNDKTYIKQQEKISKENIKHSTSIENKTEIDVGKKD